VRGGHKLNHALLCALMADASAWTWMDGEMPRPIVGHAEIASRLTPAFGPDRS
jgi:UDP-3-O-[3-hydroxymyristoyl] N-acetylglucosamine deacetylase